MNPELVAEAVTPRTRAVVPVHLYGQLARSKRWQTLPRDSRSSRTQRSPKAPPGTAGFPAVWAPSPPPAPTLGKNLGAAGDAGAVTTDDAEIAHRVRLLGAHGSQAKYVHEVIGFNSRLDTVQAVVLRHKLRRLPDWNAARRAAAARYDAMLADVPGVVHPTTRANNIHVWHLYVIRVSDRDRVLLQLHEAGIGAALHYPWPVHLTEAFKYLNGGSGSFPIAEQAATELISLPMFPHITEAQQERVVSALRGGPLR